MSAENSDDTTGLLLPNAGEMESLGSGIDLKAEPTG